MNPADIHGKRLAMLVWGERADGSDDVAVFTGVGEWDGRCLRMLRQPDPSSFQVQDEWLDRLKPVPADLRATLLDAEYYFSLTIGSLPEDRELSEYIFTGLKWPGDDSAS